MRHVCQLQRSRAMRWPQWSLRVLPWLQRRKLLRVLFCRVPTGLHWPRNRVPALHKKLFLRRVPPRVRHVCQLQRTWSLRRFDRTVPVPRGLGGRHVQRQNHHRLRNRLFGSTRLSHMLQKFLLDRERDLPRRVRHVRKLQWARQMRRIDEPVRLLQRVVRHCVQLRGDIDLVLRGWDSRTGRGV